jgi:hypothetical protein
MRFGYERWLRTPCGRVDQALAHSGFPAAWARALGLGAPVVLQHDDDGDVVVQRARYVYRGIVPPPARRLVRGPVSWVDESTYERRRHERRFRLDPAGAWRVECAGRCRFEVARPGCRMAVEGDVSVRLPVAGALAERRLVPALQQYFGRFGDALEAWYDEPAAPLPG